MSCKGLEKGNEFSPFPLIYGSLEVNWAHGVVVLVLIVAIILSCRYAYVL